MSTRNVYLISIPLRNARPHWTLWIPLDSDAVGAPQFGFKIEVEHVFDWRKTLSANTIRLFLLGTTDSSNIVDITEPSGTTDLNKNDKFEKVAARLDVPRAASSNVMPTGTVSEIAAALQHDIPGMRRCQEWTMDYIAALVKDGLLPDEAMNVIAERGN
ncbi:hypothetical protein CPB84DRAFT_1828586 [Gymnopilus junonius]|uniref:Uncharacterized protein n=1 Tax=Gymnopilus junonius TaxID=109634 RepID=A0A9P5NE93_GYMJU|nr:hypothetical protein CPB84DRAFT_1828586 [Gymnopilus junonius]